MMRDAAGCRIYARFSDVNGGVVIVKQSSDLRREKRGVQTPGPNVWVFLETPPNAQTLTEYAAEDADAREPAERSISPLLDAERVRCLIAALELHLAAVESDAGADRRSPIFDYENPVHRFRTWGGPHLRNAHSIGMRLLDTMSASFVNVRLQALGFEKLPPDPVRTLGFDRLLDWYAVWRERPRGTKGHR